MGEGERAERAEPLADVDWDTVFALASALAATVVAAQDVDDVVTEGITRVYEGTATYDPQIDHDLPLRVVEVGRDALRGERRKVQRWASGNFASGVGLALHGEALPGPEQALSDAQLQAQKAELLRRMTAECDGDTQAQAVLDCALRAIERPEDQARVAGASYEDVRSAINRVRRRFRKLKGVGPEVEDE